MYFNGKIVTDDKVLKHKHYFKYLCDIINSKNEIDIKYINQTLNKSLPKQIDSLEYIRRTYLVLEELLKNKKKRFDKKYVAINIDISVLSQCLNYDVDSYDAFTRKNIINELL